MDQLLQELLLALKPCFVPLVSGAVAGFLINWIIEQSRAKARRKKVLLALYAQVVALPGINEHNQTAANLNIHTPRPIPISYPIEPFEIALFSENSISVSEKTIEAATDYLLKAKELNAVVVALQAEYIPDRYTNVKAPAEQLLFEATKNEMPKRIELLKNCIENEQNS